MKYVTLVVRLQLVSLDPSHMWTRLDCNIACHILKRSNDKAQYKSKGKHMTHKASHITIAKHMTKHTMKETLHSDWCVFCSHFRFQFPFPVSVSSFHFCFSICPRQGPGSWNVVPQYMVHLRMEITEIERLQIESSLVHSSLAVHCRRTASYPSAVVLVLLGLIIFNHHDDRLSYHFQPRHKIICTTIDISL